MGKTRRGGSWPGGFYRIDAKGRRVYVIRRMVAGVRYEVSTRCTTLRAAMAELERFEKDPTTYRPGGDPRGAIFLDAKLVGRFLKAHAHNSRPWLARQRTLLAWWSGHLRGVDLRKATLRDHIQPALDEAEKGLAPRIVVIKRLYSWLRERDEIETAQDPTLGKLKVPQAKIAQASMSKVISPEHYEAARSHLIGAYRDALDLLAGTGWHTTELHRFASSGTIEPYHGQDPDAAAVLQTLHKNGTPHRTAVTEEVAEAAKRLREHGGISLSRFHRAVLSACDAAGIPRFRPGWFRHTIATMGTEAGHEHLVPRFLGHRSAATTRRFYATRATPPRIRTLR